MDYGSIIDSTDKYWDYRMTAGGYSLTGTRFNLAHDVSWGQNFVPEPEQLRSIRKFSLWRSQLN